ncbi:MAG: hypothetical protein L0I76_06050 [Pseudonocardia sp.]|nr:hypothetical protein [Pseudonocardia sp.]
MSAAPHRAPVDDALILAAGGASVWTSWIVNLLVAEWWLLRRRAGAAAPVPTVAA